MLLVTADCLPIALCRADGPRRSRSSTSAGRASSRGSSRPGASRPSARGLAAAIGPGIGPCCYEVGEEVAEPFRERFGDDVPARPEPRPAARRRAGPSGGRGRGCRATRHLHGLPAGALLLAPPRRRRDRPPGSDRLRRLTPSASATRGLRAEVGADRDRRRGDEVRLRRRTWPCWPRPGSRSWGRTALQDLVAKQERWRRVPLALHRPPPVAEGEGRVGSMRASFTRSAPTRPRAGSAPGPRRGQPVRRGLEERRLRAGAPGLPRGGAGARRRRSRPHDDAALHRRSRSGRGPTSGGSASWPPSTASPSSRWARRRTTASPSRRARRSCGWDRACSAGKILRPTWESETSGTARSSTSASSRRTSLGRRALYDRRGGARALVRRAAKRAADPERRGAGRGPEFEDWSEPGGLAEPRRTAVLRPPRRRGPQLEAVASAYVNVHLVVPRSFNDAQSIADRFKDACR